jgi:hypothetical protein
MVVDAPYLLFQLFLTMFDAGDGDWHSLSPFFGLWILLLVSQVHVAFLSSFNFSGVWTLQLFSLHLLLLLP